MKNRSFPWAIIAAAAVAGAGLAGVASYVNTHSPKPVDVSTHEQPGEVVATNASNQDDNQQSNEASNTPVVERIDKAEALTKALNAKNYGEFRVLKVTVEEKGNAIIDMNNRLLQGMGSEAEADFIDTVKSAMAQFKDVNTFQIRVDGEILKSLSHFEMLEPVPVR